MSPENLFWLTLILKMAIASCSAIATTVVAERSRPLVGGLIASLPVSAGPSYVFLALDHDAAFISATALTSLAMNAGTALYSFVFVMIAQKNRFWLSAGLAVSAWLACAAIIHSQIWTLPLAIALNIVVLGFCHFAARPFRKASMPRFGLRVSDLVVRAVLVAALVAAVITLSFRIGPNGTGILAVFPVLYTSVMFIIHRRSGGQSAAAVFANGFIGLAGFGIGMAALYLTVIPLGKPLALSLALAICVSWNLAIYVISRFKIVPPAQLSE